MRALTWIKLAFGLVCFCIYGGSGHINLMLKVYVISDVFLTAWVTETLVCEFRLCKLSGMSLVQFFRFDDGCYSYNFTCVWMSL